MYTLSYCIYVVQLLPVVDPGRIKVGRTMNAEKRIISYQTIVPEAKYVAVWYGPVTRQDEMKAITLINRIDGVQRLSAEVFRVDSIEIVIEVLSNHFGPVQEYLMPLPSIQSKLRWVDAVQVLLG